MKYKRRIIDNMLKQKIEGKGAVLIEGSKWCGKTTTAEQIAESVLYVDSIETNIADMNLAELLRGDAPRLIDEWQLAPKLWDAIRFVIDRRGELGQFVLTGSAVPTDTKEITHSGTGRFAWLTMRPMSLYESGDSNGAVSLKALFDKNTEIDGESKLDINRLAFLACRGGLPQSVNLPKNVAIEAAKNYFDSVANLAANHVNGMYISTEDVKMVMRSYARNQGRQISNTAITQDIATACGSSANEKMVSDCLNVLRSIFVIEESPAWNPYLRHGVKIHSADTEYFVDPSLAIAALDISPDDLISNPTLFESIFKTLCMRDLRVYADSIGGRVYHYCDKNGLKCDAVIQLRNDKYGLIEIKLGSDDEIENGVENLMALQNKIDYTKMRKPSFMMVLTGVGKYAYRRKDGICIVPIGCLKN